MNGLGEPSGWAEELAGEFPDEALADDAALTELSTDFGRIIRRKPGIGVRPRSTGGVQHTIRFAAQRSLRVAPRGTGHSQNGQSLSDQIVLDLRDLNRVLRVDPQSKTVVCQAGVTWRRLLEALLPEGLSPPVLTNNLDVTVGGAISTAGLGVASWRFGTQADHCLECEVVTGSGDAVRCSSRSHADLFDAVRAGAGQFGVITEVTLRLRRHKRRTRTLYLLYDNLNFLLSDLRALVEEERFDYLEAWCAPLAQGFRAAAGRPQPFAQWFFPLHVSYEIDAPPGANAATKLQGLRYYKHVHTEDREIGAFFARLDPLFELWKHGGFWDFAHPWVECILPWQSAAVYVSQSLEAIQPQTMIGGHVLLWPGRPTASSVPLFMRPKSELVMGFGILPAVPRERLPEALPLLNQASRAAVLAGGKRYVSGWVGFNPGEWQAHYGDLYAKLLELKGKYDPHRVFPFQFDS